MLLNVTYRQFCRYLICLVALLCMSVSLLAWAGGLVEQLLDEADQNLAADRLMTPINNNAFDRYQAVLLLDKGNQRAMLGIRAVAKRYLILARSGAERRSFSKARKLLARAIAVNGRTPATDKVTQYIEHLEKLALASKPAGTGTLVDVVDPRQTVFMLNPSDLRQRDLKMAEQLWSLGRRVQASEEYVLIYARTDSEGRWIYQQMRKGSLGYRLRGNIKRHHKPKVVLQPPLN